MMRFAKQCEAGKRQKQISSDKRTYRVSWQRENQSVLNQAESCWFAWLHIYAAEVNFACVFKVRFNEVHLAHRDPSACYDNVALLSLDGIHKRPIDCLGIVFDDA
jgi:hypothetical protein